MPSEKRTYFRVVIVSVALIAVILAAEMIARKISPTYQRMHGAPHPFFRHHPTRGWDMVPGYQGRATWGVDFRVNNLGFRGPDISLEKPAGTYRVLVLGDSIAMGTGLTEEVLVSAKLEQALSRLSPGTSFQVINGGIAGYDVEEERMLLEEKGLELDPDAVILVACLNDVPDVQTAEQVNPLRDVPIPGEAWLLQNSALALLIQGLYNQIGIEHENRLWSMLRAERHAPTMDRIEGGWQEYEAELSRMVNECRDRGIKFVVVLTPHAAQFEDSRKRFLPQARFKAIADRLGIAYIDMAPEFAALPELPYIFPDPIHPDPSGHELMAEKIAGRLMENFQ